MIVYYQLIIIYEPWLLNDQNDDQLRNDLLGNRNQSNHDIVDNLYLFIGCFLQVHFKSNGMTYCNRFLIGH